MKKSSLVLLVAAFAAGSLWLGCGQDKGPLASGAGPADLVPAAKKGGGGGGGGGGTEGVLLMDLEEGMLTTDLPVNVVTDSRKKINLETNAFADTMNFTNPGDWYEIKAGAGKGQPDISQEEGDALQAELGPDEFGNPKVVENGRLYMLIDKAGLEPGGATSGGHHFIVEYVGALGRTGIQIGGPYGTPVTVAWLSHTETVDTFQFTGTVIVWNGSSPKDSRMIGCPGVGPEPNKVVVRVTR